MSTLIKIDGITVTKGNTKTAPTEFPNNNFLIPPKNVKFKNIGNKTLTISIEVDIDSNSSNPPTLNTISNEFRYIQYFLEYDYPYEKPQNLTTWTLTGSFTTSPFPSPIKNNLVEVFTRDKNNNQLDLTTENPKTSRGTEVTVSGDEDI